MKYSCIVVDDELEPIELLIEYIEMIPVLDLKCTFTDPLKALDTFKTLTAPIDFLFLDIQMPEMSGFELAKEIRTKVKHLIIVTGFEQQWQDLYAVNTKHFLEKPFNFKKFEKVVNDVFERLLYEHPSITLHVGGNTSFELELNKLLVAEAGDHYVTFFTTEGQSTHYYKISQLEEDLKRYGIFIRVNKSIIISKNAMSKSDGSTVYLKDGRVIKVGDKYKHLWKQYRDDFL